MGKSTVGAKWYRRSDGVIGVGFVIHHGGLDCLSIAWPDIQSRQYAFEDAARQNIVEAGEFVQKAEADLEASKTIEGLRKENEKLKDRLYAAQEEAILVPILRDEIKSLKSGSTEDKTVADTSPPSSKGTAPDSSHLYDIDEAEEREAAAGGNTSNGIDSVLIPQVDEKTPGNQESTAPSNSDGGATEEMNSELIPSVSSGSAAGKAPALSEAEQIRHHLEGNPDASNKEVIAWFDCKGIKITTSQVSKARKKLAS